MSTTIYERVNNKTAKIFNVNIYGTVIVETIRLMIFCDQRTVTKIALGYENEIMKYVTLDIVRVVCAGCGRLYATVYYSPTFD